MGQLLEISIPTANRQIEALRQAKLTSAEELASILEPLAQAMAALTDETRTSLEQIEQRSREQGEQLRSQTETAIISWNQAAKAAQQAAERLDEAGRRVELNHYLLAILTGVVAGLLASTFLLWLAPARMVQNALDAKAVAELLRPEIAALKPRKGK